MREDAEQCILWGGALTSEGYGRIGKRGKAHRMAYEKANGPIPEGMCVCHHCDIPACVNPSHLFLGTVAENNRDRHEKGRSKGLFPSGNDHPSRQRLGSSHWRAKLSDDDVRAIRRLRLSGIGVQEIAARFGVNSGTVSRIARGVWRTEVAA